MASVGGTYFIFASLVFKSDFTNRMDIDISNRTGTEPSGIHAAGLLIRHPCRIPLIPHHSVSEIADFSPEPCKDEIGAARRCHCLPAPYPSCSPCSLNGNDDREDPAQGIGYSSRWYWQGSSPAFGRSKIYSGALWEAIRRT